MRLAEPVCASWKAELSLAFVSRNGKTILSEKRHDGPLVVQKPLYPEGDAVCHAIVVHPPAGIAGGDELEVSASIKENSHVLLTTPGASKWYRSAGPWARQRIGFEVDGCLEWLPQETIVFDGALSEIGTEVRLSGNARYIGWEILCLGRTGSGERFGKGEIRVRTRIARDGRPLWIELGRIDGGGKLTASPAGLGGRSVCATLLAAGPGINVQACRRIDGLAVTLLPDLLVARYLGDSSEAARQKFVEIWKILRPMLLGRPACEPRIWST